MAIVNRSNDASQQKDAFQYTEKLVTTGVTFPVAIMPYPCTLQSVRGVAQGISGTPIVSLYKASGSVGATLEAIGISGIVVAVMGTSAPAGQSMLAASGSTLLDFAAGDVLYAISTGSNAAADNFILEYVVKKTQDVVSHNGISG